MKPNVKSVCICFLSTLELMTVRPLNFGQADRNATHERTCMLVCVSQWPHSWRCHLGSVLCQACLLWRRGRRPRPSPWLTLPLRLFWKQQWLVVNSLRLYVSIWGGADSPDTIDKYHRIPVVGVFIDMMLAVPLLSADGWMSEPPWRTTVAWGRQQQEITPPPPLCKVCGTVRWLSPGV